MCLLQVLLIQLFPRTTPLPLLNTWLILTKIIFWSYFPISFPSLRTVLCKEILLLNSAFRMHFEVFCLPCHHMIPQVLSKRSRHQFFQVSTSPPRHTHLNISNFVTLCSLHASQNFSSSSLPKYCDSEYNEDRKSSHVRKTMVVIEEPELWTSKGNLWVWKHRLIGTVTDWDLCFETRHSFSSYNHSFIERFSETQKLNS